MRESAQCVNKPGQCCFSRPTHHRVGFPQARSSPRNSWGPPLHPTRLPHFASMHLSPFHQVTTSSSSLHFTSASAPPRQAPSPPPVLFASGHVSGVPPPENVVHLEGNPPPPPCSCLRRPLSWTAWTGRSVRTCGCFHFLVRPITLLRWIIA